MKKLLAFLVAFVMMLSVASSAFATAGSLFAELLAEKEAPFQNNKASKLETTFTSKSYMNPAVQGKLPTTNFVPTRSSGKLYGFVNAGYGAPCWAEIDVNTPDTYTVISSVVGGEVFAAVYDCVTETTYAYWLDSAGAGKFGIADVASGTLIPLSDSPEHISALAIDYTTYTVYALAVESSTLYEVDIDNGAFTSLGQIENVSRNPFLMAIDENGTMYVIDDMCILYTIDTDLLQATTIGSTGLSLDYAQSITYDYESGQIYWAHYNTTGSLYSVDVNNAQVSYLGTLNGAEICGLHTRPNKESVNLPDPVPMEGIEIAETAISIPEYETATVSATLLPLGGFFEDRSIEWSSSDETVATVSNRGLITGVAPGTAVITATADSGNFQDTVLVTVIAASEYYRDISDAMNVAAFGEEGYYVYSTGNGGRYPFAATQKDGRDCVVSTNNTIIPSTSMIQNCKPEFFIGGSVITWDWKLYDEADVDDAIFFANGEMQKYVFGSMDWTTESYTIPKTGYYTFGWGHFRSFAHGLEIESCLWVDNVQVEMMEPAEFESIDVFPESIFLYPTDSTALQVMFNPINVSNANVTFTSLNPDVATVNNKGLVVGVSEGDTTVRIVTEETGYVKEIPIRIRNYHTAEQLTYKPAAIGQSYEFVLGGEDSQIFGFGYATINACGFELNMQEGDAATFITSPGMSNPIDDPQIIILDANYNIIQSVDDIPESAFPTLRFIPKTPGKYYVIVASAFYYTDGIGSCILNIEKYTPIHVAGIELKSEVINVGFNMYAQATASLLPVVNDYPGITWSIEDTTIATVDKDGRIYGLSCGTTTLTATSIDGGHIDTATVIVGEQIVPQYNGRLYGFNLYDEAGIMPNGFISYEIGEDGTELTQETFAKNDIYSCAYLNGMLYAYEYVSYVFYGEPYYVVLDADTFAIQQKVPMSSSNLVPIEMAYNHLTGVMYASVLDAWSGGCGLYTVDLDTGSITLINTLDFVGAEYPLPMYAMDFDNNGNLYGIGGDSVYYSINPENAEMTKITDTEYNVSMLQSMTFNHHDGFMYWFALEDDAAHIVQMEPETGYNVMATGTGSTGFMQITAAFVYTQPDSITPDEPIELTEISLSENELTLGLYESVNITVNYTPENTTDRGITWHSTHPGVAFVDSTGKVTGVNAGSAYVVATSTSGLTSRVLVTVENPTASDIPAGYAKVTLTASDVWGDGTGYQLLLDADATVSQQGIIYEGLGALAEYGDISSEIYDMFEYKIPENADGSTITSNVVCNDSVTILIPAGVYDWCVTNPMPGNTVYIAGDGVGISYSFHEGFSYEFSLTMSSFGDKVIVDREYLGTNVAPAVTHTVTFLDNNDDILATYIVEDGKDAIAPAVSELDYWLFYGWTGAPLTNVTEDITVKATYYRLGDANMDNAVNTGDAALILAHIVQTASLTDFQIQLGNINQDNGTNTGDAAMVLMIIVGLLPAPW